MWDAAFSFDWDLDNDGTFETRGQSVTFSAASLDGPSSHTVQVQVQVQVVGDNGPTETETATVNVLNVAPTARFENSSGAVSAGQSATLAFFNAFDPSAADTAAGFLYSYDCTNDGPFELSDTSATSYPCAYPVAGTFTARGRIKDKDGGFTDATVSIFVEDVNQAPIANAGPNQTVDEGSLVSLDGTGSQDPDGDSLTFSWRQLSGTGVTLSDPASPTPSFTAPLVGPSGESLVFRLTVSDGVFSPTADVSIRVQDVNQRPIADAGPDQTAAIGTPVTLDGTRSSDPDGDTPLAFSWTVASSPAGSTAFIREPAASLTTFTPDRHGDYVIRLVVTDSRGLASVPDEAIVSTINSAPVADAGLDQQVTVLGTVVQLDGTLSMDPDGDPLTFFWSFEDKPAGSTAALSDPASAQTTFVADLKGDYLLSLVVTDALGAMSTPDRVLVSSLNVPPVADAGVLAPVLVGDTVILDGSASFDANGDPLTFRWTLVSAPFGSAAVLDEPNSVSTSFVADLPGTYIASLVVHDGQSSSPPDNVTVTASLRLAPAIESLREAVEVLMTLPDEDFKNPNLRTDALPNKIHAAVEQIDQCLLEDAQKKLENDVLAKSDGCETTGEPDKNDWISSCPSQAMFSPRIQDAIERLDLPPEPCIPQ